MSNIPIIKLRDTEKIWLQRVYQHFFNDQKVSYRELRAWLNADLPINFDINTIDKRLLTFNGERPSLLGVIAVEGNDTILDECNQIVLAIKNILIKQPLANVITSQEISLQTGIEKRRVQLLLNLITHYGNFFSGGSMTQDGIGIDTLNLNTDDNIFNFYMRFQDMRDLLAKYLKEDEENEKSRIEHKRNLSAVMANDFMFSQESKKDPIFLDKVNPYFRATNISTNKHRCFVIMPFTLSWSSTIYTDCIRPNVESLGLTCMRADNLNGPIIVEDVWTEINMAAFIVADVTGQNSNVMYELGIAHTLGKPVILLTQELDKIPFDFKHHRHYEYVNQISGKSFFEKEFKGIIRDLYAREYPDTAKMLNNS